MTPDAATLVHTLVHAGRAATGGGVRIVINGGTDSLTMALADCPEATDDVLTQGEARLFMSAPAARRTQGQTLCAEIKPLRSLFFLRPG